MPKVLISDELSDAAVQIFRDRGVEVDFQPQLGKDKARLAEIIGNYDGLAIRSATKVTADLIAKAGNLRVIGRAGIGVDNVDIPAASAKGIVVMNTPFGNSITTAEHAIAMMFAVRAADPGGGCLDPGREVGEVEVHGRRDHRQDAGADRRRQYRLGGRHPRHRAEDEGDRLRSVPVGRAGAGARGSSGSTRWTTCWRGRISSRCMCRRPRRPRTSSRRSGSRG